MQPGVQQRQRHDDDQAGDQHGHREDGLGQRDHAHLAGRRMARRGDQHGDAGRQAQAVHGEAAIGRRDDQRVVHALDLQRQLLGDHAADHQAEAPVQVAADAADQRGDDDGGARLVHVADDAVQQAVGQRRGGQHIAHRQDHGHLRGEGQQAPEALAPGRGHGRQALAFDADGQQHGEQCQRDREDEGSGRYLRISSVKRTPIYSCCLQQTPGRAWFCAVSIAGRTRLATEQRSSLCGRARGPVAAVVGALRLMFGYSVSRGGRQPPPALRSSQAASSASASLFSRSTRSRRSGLQA